MQKDGKGEGERVQTVGTFGHYNDCLAKWVDYGIPLTRKNQLVEYFILILDKNNKYVDSVMWWGI
tara:strand:+ start:10191 stop:10385 length:195 start_codon:yes stop_codon:yes gene_type:complete